MQKILTFAYDSVETENKNKEVLEYQLVTTSWSQDTLRMSDRVLLYMGRLSITLFSKKSSWRTDVVEVDY